MVTKKEKEAYEKDLELSQIEAKRLKDIYKQENATKKAIEFHRSICRDNPNECATQIVESECKTKPEKEEIKHACLCQCEKERLRLDPSNPRYNCNQNVRNKEDIERSQSKFFKRQTIYLERLKEEGIEK